jgi:cation:H+ antiporter
MVHSLLAIGVAVVVASAVLWYACTWLEGASHELAEYYGLPDIVKGSVITAVSSSMPELATAVLAIPVHGDFELGLSVIIGSAIYNILVIPAFSVFVRRRSLHANRELIFRETLFYLVSVIALLLVICLAVVYGGSDDGDGSVRGTLTPGLALIPLVLYGLYLFIQYEEVLDHREKLARRTDLRAWKAWGTLLACIGLIMIGVEVLLRCALALGELLDTATFLWGMTIVAAATSIPDTFISVRASQADRPVSSISNVLGSNVFDLLVAVPAGVLIAGSVSVNFTQVVPMMGFLVIATIALLVFMRRDLKITMNEAIAMMGLYLGFGIWMALEAFGVTTVLGLP